MAGKTINVNLKIWRQRDAKSKGRFVDYRLENISTEMSFLEMLDILNEKIIKEDKDPVSFSKGCHEESGTVSFDHDCREGICGMCSLVINGIPHGNDDGITVCQLHMRKFKNEETIVVEPWRAKAFPVIKDLVVDRSALDRIISSGGYIDVKTGAPQDANAIPVPKDAAEKSMDAAACIGCGACVAACKNASAMLFTSAKIAHLGYLPQGKVETTRRVKNMLKAMEKEGFGNCTNEAECEAVCPKKISISNIAKLNRDYIKSLFS